MKRLLFLICLSSLLNNNSYTQVNDQAREGKLLQGDKWIKFSYPEKADFYVSPSEMTAGPELFLTQTATKAMVLFLHWNGHKRLSGISNQRFFFQRIHRLRNDG